MKKLIFSVLALLTFTTMSYANFSEGKIIFDLYPQEGKQVYAVGYQHEGQKYWYQIGTPGTKRGKTMKRLLLVYYDTISKNFYVQSRGQVEFVTINRDYEIKFHDRTVELPEETYPK